MKAPNNPFVLTGYYGKSYFCDRETELEQMASHIKNDRNIVLYSWRRLGKSALIKCYLDEAEKEGAIEGVYVDLMATSNIDQAIDAIIEGVYERFGKTESGITQAFIKLVSSLGISISFDAVSGLPTFSIKKFNQPHEAAPSLQKIGNFLSKRSKTVVLAIDEFQQVSHYEGQHAEAVFRSFMQSFPQIRFVYSGSHRHMMTSMFTASSRPFYKSCQLMSIDPIPLEKYTPFIQLHFKQAGKSIAPELIAQIYAWSRGQTYTIQLLCNLLYGKDKHPDEASLEESRQSILEQDAAIFTQFEQLLTRAQWSVLMAIAKEGKVKNPLSKAFISRHGLGASSTVSSALKALVNRAIIVRESDGYFVHDILFGRWLERL